MWPGRPTCHALALTALENQFLGKTLLLRIKFPGHTDGQRSVPSGLPRLLRPFQEWGAYCHYQLSPYSSWGPLAGGTMAPAKDHGTKATPWPFIPWPRGLDGFLSAGAVQCSSTRRWMLLMASKLPGPSSFWINYISKPELSLKIGWPNSEPTRNPLSRLLSI